VIPSVSRPVTWIDSRHARRPRSLPVPVVLQLVLLDHALEHRFQFRDAPRRSSMACPSDRVSRPCSKLTALRRMRTTRPGTRPRRIVRTGCTTTLPAPTFTLSPMRIFPRIFRARADQTRCRW